LNHAVKISEKVYQKAPVSLYNHSLFDNGSGDLREAVKLQKDKRANVFFVEGKSRKPDLKLGSFIKMKGIVNGETSFSGGTVPLETYRVVALTNHHDGLDDYYNTFVAVPFEIVVPDYMNDDAVPVCEEQMAVVVDNNDPKGLGRVRVQFLW
jgi:type VI secretion system secreted protein VgrG